jgi:hypothetical protein
MTTYTYSYRDDPHAESFAFEHDKDKRVFRLTDAEGNAEYFRDNPEGYLVVEPDPETGEIWPARKCGKPMLIYLCREDLEL